MNDPFDELAESLAQSVTRCGAVPLRTTLLLCLAISAPFAPRARGDDFRLGPVSDLSDPDAFAGCGSNGAEKECSIAANPTNPRNLAVSWIGGGFKGMGAAVSLDGGKRWQQVLIPALSICNGGTQDFDGNADPGLSFSPDGALYHLCLAGNSSSGRNAVLVSKSVDGGLHWASPIILWDTTDKRFYPDYTHLTADPFDARYVYANWDNCDSGNRGPGLLARTTDGGRTWEPARVIYDPGTANNGTLGHTINVLPGGALVDVFTEFKFSDDGIHKGALLSVIRSPDKGVSWSAPIRAAAIPVFSVIDPETGVSIVNSSSCCPNPASATDPQNGNLYVVWEDTRFSNGRYSSIALSMSADGGLTWSAPIQVNQTPSSIAAANRQAFIPAVAVAADGTIGVTYYDFRFNDANPGLLTDYWLVHCHPSAATPPTDPASWGNEVRLTDASFDLEKAAQNGTFVGDYEGLTTVGKDFVAAWSMPHDHDLDSVFVRRAGP
jgi:hypothetical protein